MNDWIIIAAVLAATTGVSVTFWCVLMPRLAGSKVGKPARVGAIIGFGVLLFAIPVVGWFALTERTVALICALLIGWGMAVRASGWFAARRFFVPRLAAMRREERDAANQPPEPRT